MSMASIIVTSANEPNTIGLSLSAILKQMQKGDELVVVCPDGETQQAAAEVVGEWSGVNFIRDENKGKPAAMEMALTQISQEIVVLSDGDVVIEDDALMHLLQPFKDDDVGLVTGQPVSQNARNTKYGFWSVYLTEVAHRWRLTQAKKQGFLVGSGYLMAFRRGLLPTLPSNLLAEDAFISQKVAEQQKQLVYEPKAKVRVVFPQNWSDWVKQKLRSTGGYAQDYILQSSFQSRSGIRELLGGLLYSSGIAQNGRERIWLIQLFLARLYLWILIYYKVSLLHQSRETLWQRVESTK